MFALLKRLKFSYAFYNLFQKPALQHNVQYYKKYGIKKAYYSAVSSKDFEGITSPKNAHDTLDSAQELPKNSSFLKLDLETQTALRSWSNEGFVILKNHLSTLEVDKVNLEVEKLAKQRKVRWQHNARIMFGIHHSKLLAGIGQNTKLISILEMLLSKEVELFQSINFLNASQQRTHSDSIHMSTFPYGNIIAVWIALEDIDDENGPLHYYPGSNKLPYIMNKDFGNEGSTFLLGNKTYGAYEDKIAEIVEQNKLQKQTFKAKKGDLLIWHANLLHGGEPLIDKKRTRKSMVFHYYAKDAICFHEITQRPTLKKPF